MAEFDFTALEERDGIRMAWNVWPNSKLEATKCVIPFTALYSPAKRLPKLQEALPYDPIPCKQCGAILNPYARVDFNSKVWICPFCMGRNHFPPHYHSISEQYLPAELFADNTTIEYHIQSAPQPHPPVFLFLIDTCVSEDELNGCKQAILAAVGSLPEYVHIGLVTFGTHVHVYELGFEECTKCYVFRGGKEYTSAQIVDQLGLRGAGQRAAGAPPTQRFLLPMEKAEFAFTTAIEELQKDAYAVSSTQRPARCTGTAVQVAAALLGASLPVGNCQARIMSFIGGPCTEGPGKVVGRDLIEELRSHKDIAKDAAPHMAKARKFYTSVAHELVAHGHAFDVFACSLDQVGFAEMRDMVMLTGGMSCMSDTFHNVVFKESLKRMFAQPGQDGFIGLCSNATLEVVPSKDIKVAGLLGPAARSDKKSPHAAEQEVGLGGTNVWKMAGMDHDTTVGVVFEITSNNKDGDGGQGNQQLFIQFITKYLDPAGLFKTRVTTVSRSWVDPGNLPLLVTGFDQEAAAVLMARLASHKMDSEEDFEATRWLDRALIRLCQRFGDYRQDDPSTFFLRPELSFYPMFMFNLRRSMFVQVFGNSPDETAYFRLVLFRVSVPDAMVMIQPQLFAYELQQETGPVLLDVKSILPQRILLLDAYFYVVVHCGTTIASWRKANYHLQPEHAAFAQLLAAPTEEAKKLAAARFPVPKIVECDQNGSQARFLLARLNPSNTHASSNMDSVEVINTDDVSLETFTEHLKRLAVAS